MRTIEFPRSDAELPACIRARIAEMIAVGYTREHLLISENGQVSFDPEASAFEARMKRLHPELARGSYMAVVFPSRIVVSE